MGADWLTLPEEILIRSLFISLTQRSTRARRRPRAAGTSDSGSGLKHSFSELAHLEARVLPTPVDAFLRAVSTANAAVRDLASALSTHLCSPASPGPNLESLLNRAFHADFELDADVHTLDPAGQCKATLAAYHAVAVLTWEEPRGSATSAHQGRVERLRPGAVRAPTAPRGTRGLRHALRPAVHGGRRGCSGGKAGAGPCGAAQRARGPERRRSTGKAAAAMGVAASGACASRGARA
ncbi:hypothetical protein U9M48_010739 [Paspalum notatum var. saurae]|uniref:Uncharacterized protein n=1 Tax=Paspalum notatum var. saurae TaxID=547442 RepID=A0AAQ3STU1_PASNO